MADNVEPRPRLAPSVSSAAVWCSVSAAADGPYRRGIGAPTGVVQRGVFGFAAPLGISAERRRKYARDAEDQAAPLERA
jgi:hypothetical protein